MPQTEKNRDEVVNKLAIVNKIIRKGYDNVANTLTLTHREYCNSIKNHNFFQIREQLMMELYPLVYSNHNF